MDSASPRSSSRALRPSGSWFQMAPRGAGLRPGSSKFCARTPPSDPAGGKAQEIGTFHRVAPHPTLHPLVIPEIDQELISYLQSRFPLGVRSTLDDYRRQEGRHEVKGPARVIALQTRTMEVGGCGALAEPARSGTTGRRGRTAQRTPLDPTTTARSRKFAVGNHRDAARLLAARREYEIWCWPSREANVPLRPTLAENRSTYRAAR